MKQDVGFFDVGSDCPDLVIENGDLKADNSLETASLISLFSDKRVPLEDLPKGEEDQRGWWADQISESVGDQIGSTLWLHDRGKVLQTTVGRIKDAIQDSLNWMIDDGIAKSVVATANLLDNQTIAGSAQITKPDGENIPFKFVWDGQALKLLE